MSRVEEDVLLGGRYRLARRMAAGGMGQVWEAEDTVLHRTVAVKVLSEGLSSDPNSAERFRREARAAAGLAHPNVASVFDYGEDDGTQFIVMELVDGETLADRIGRVGRLDPAEAARVAGRIAAALEVAHGAGIVHRDVKPGNVMLTPEGEVKVLDFGIAAAAGSNLTATGFTIGTAAYLSPEQAAGERATPASDVYALGVVLYEMLAGRPPFTGETPVAVAAAHVSREAPALAGEVPGIPAHLAEVCERALAKDPELRPATAGELRRMLEGSDRGGPEPLAASTDAPSTPSETATAVLPPAESTAMLPGAAPAIQQEPKRPPAAARATDAPRRRSAWILAVMLASILLLALVLASVLGGDLSSPGAVKVRVPKLVGLELAEARSSLRQAGFKVGDIKRIEGPPDTVIRTDPPEGESVGFGTSVTLFVGAVPEPPTGDEDEGGQGKGKGKGKGGDEGDD
jgi:eukaryotic-like serine/threonine-protein kinase